MSYKMIMGLGLQQLKENPNWPYFEQYIKDFITELKDELPDTEGEDLRANKLRGAIAFAKNLLGNIDDEIKAALSEQEEQAAKGEPNG